MAARPVPPAPHDGSTGNVLQRAEPKVKAASLTALLTPLALYYLYRYVPGADTLPHELDAVVATLVTGSATFAAGFMARAVDRIDLFAKPYAAKAQKAADRTLGAKTVDEVEGWVKDIATPVKAAVVDAVHAVEQAAQHGEDPVAAAEAAAPTVEASLAQAVAAGRAEAETVLAPALAQAEADAPAVVAQVAAAPQKSAAELMAELQKMIAALDPQATPIGDAAQAAVTPAPVTGPPTTLMPVVPAPAAPAPVEQAPLTAPIPVVASTPTA